MITRMLVAKLLSTFDGKFEAKLHPFDTWVDASWFQSQQTELAIFNQDSIFFQVSFKRLGQQEKFPIFAECSNFQDGTSPSVTLSINLALSLDNNNSKDGRNIHISIHSELTCWYPDSAAFSDLS